MSEKRIASTPKVFQVTARPIKRHSPSPNASNQSSTILNTSAKRVATAPTTIPKVTLPPTQPTIVTNQGVFQVKLVSDNAQSTSSTPSNLLIQPQSLQKTFNSKTITLMPRSNLQKIAPSAIPSNTTILNVNAMKAKLKELETDDIYVPELPLHVIVETQFIEKEKLSENCLRTILHHEVEIRNKSKADQLLPANLRGELRKAANHTGLIAAESTVDSKADIIILSDDDSNSNGANENGQSDSDSQQYVIKLDASLASFLTESSGTQLIIPPTLLGLDENDGVITLQGDQNQMSLTMQDKHEEQSILNTQNPPKSNSSEPNLSLPIISEVTSQDQSQQHFGQQMSLPPIVQQLGKSLLGSLNLVGGANLPVIIQPPQLQLQSPRAQINIDTSAVSGVLSQAHGQLQIAGVQHQANSVKANLPAIKEVMSQGELQLSKPTSEILQPSCQSNTSRTSGIGVQTNQKSTGQGTSLQQAPKEIIRSTATNVQKRGLTDIEMSPDLPVSHILKNRSVSIKVTPKFHDQIVQTISSVKSVESMTDPPSPQKNCSIQCDIFPPLPPTVSIAIQCNLTDSKSNSKRYFEPFEEIQIHNNFDQDKFKFYKTGKWECLVCGEVGDNNDHIAPHYQKHAEKSTLCTYCGKSFKNTNNLKFHEINVHKMRLLPKKKYRLICPYPSCGKIKYTFPDLYDHINFHTHEKPHKCSCTKTFHSYKKLEWHRINMTCPKPKGEYPYSNLSKWNRKHKINFRKIFKNSNVIAILFKRESNRERACTACYKICRSSLALKDHIRGVLCQKFKCKICKKEIFLKYLKHHLKAEKLLRSQEQKWTVLQR